MATFSQGLKPHVCAKLIEHKIGRNMHTLEELITTASLIDKTLFEARKETQGTTSNTTASTSEPLDGKSGGFLTLEIREKRRKAGQCPKRGDSGHVFKKCTRGWTLNAAERPKSTTGKAANLIDLEEPAEAGKV